MARRIVQQKPKTKQSKELEAILDSINSAKLELASLGLQIKQARNDLNIETKKRVDVLNLIESEEAMAGEAQKKRVSLEKSLKNFEEEMAKKQAILADEINNLNLKKEEAQKAFSTIDVELKNKKESTANAILRIDDEARKAEEGLASSLLRKKAVEEEVQNMKSQADNYKDEAKKLCADRIDLIAAYDKAAKNLSEINSDIQSIRRKKEEEELSIVKMKLEHDELEKSISSNLKLIAKQEEEVSAQKETLLSLVRKEERVNALAEKVKALYAKAGIPVVIE